ncbi:MAG TPA: hypothetical protein DCS93_37595 [Microscillaceae bacterium]|nr:hypothetical protein [Microscillaceae bacterium]
MHHFSTIEQAFEYFLENIYPNLSPAEKNKVKNTKYEYYKEGVKVSHKRMMRVMNEYADFEISYNIQPKSSK